MFDIRVKRRKVESVAVGKSDRRLVASAEQEGDWTGASRASTSAKSAKGSSSGSRCECWNCGRGEVTDVEGESVCLECGTVNSSYSMQVRVLSHDSRESSFERELGMGCGPASDQKECLTGTNRKTLEQWVSTTQTPCTEETSLQGTLD